MYQTNYHISNRGRYGDIAYAKSWCGFQQPRASTALYRAWREAIRAHMTARSLDPRRLSDSQLESVLGFARSLQPVAARIKLVQTKHQADDVDEVERHLRILVKDTAKKLQTTNERRRAERAEVGEVDEPLSKCSF